MKMFSTLTLRKFHWTRLLKWISLIALAVTWLLLLLVSISPLKSIYFVELVYGSHSSLVSIDGSVRFGVWGYCYSGLEVPLLKSSHDGSWECSPRHLGYQLDSSIAKALRVDGLANAISSGLAFALALHLVDVILVLITAATLFLPERVNRYLDPVCPQNTSLVFFIASSFTFVVVVVTVIVDYVLSDGIKRVAAHVLQASSGSALRLAEVAAFILLIVWVCAGINMYHRRGISRSSKVHGTTAEHVEMPQNTWQEFGLEHFNSNAMGGQPFKFSAAPLGSP